MLISVFKKVTISKVFLLFIFFSYSSKALSQVKNSCDTNIRSLSNLKIPKGVTIALFCSDTSKFIYTSTYTLKSEDEEKIKLFAEENAKAWMKNLAQDFNADNEGWLLDNGYHIVDRDYLNEILKEQKLSVSGFVSPQSAIKLGELIGASHILITKLTINRYIIDEKPPHFKSHTHCEFYYKLIDTKTGQVINIYNNFCDREEQH